MRSDLKFSNLISCLKANPVTNQPCGVASEGQLGDTLNRNQHQVGFSHDSVGARIQQRIHHPPHTLPETSKLTADDKNLFCETPTHRQHKKPYCPPTTHGLSINPTPSGSLQTNVYCTNPILLNHCLPKRLIPSSCPLMCAYPLAAQYSHPPGSCHVTNISMYQL